MYDNLNHALMKAFMEKERYPGDKSDKEKQRKTYIHNQLKPPLSRRLWPVVRPANLGGESRQTPCVFHGFVLYSIFVWDKTETREISRERRK